MKRLYRDAQAAGNAPCYECENRHSLCHKDCSGYLAWKEEVEKIRALRYNDSGYEYAAYVGDKITREDARRHKSSMAYRERFKSKP